MDKKKGKKNSKQKNSSHSSSHDPSANFSSLGLDDSTQTTRTSTSSRSSTQAPQQITFDKYTAAALSAGRRELPRQPTPQLSLQQALRLNPTTIRRNSDPQVSAQEYGPQAPRISYGMNAHTNTKNRQLSTHFTLPSIQRNQESRESVFSPRPLSQIPPPLNITSLSTPTTPVRAMTTKSLASSPQNNNRQEGGTKSLISSPTHNPKRRSAQQAQSLTSSPALKRLGPTSSPNSQPSSLWPPEIKTTQQRSSSSTSSNQFKTTQSTPTSSNNPSRRGSLAGFQSPNLDSSTPKSKPASPSNIPQQLSVTKLMGEKYNINNLGNNF